MVDFVILLVWADGQAMNKKQKIKKGIILAFGEIFLKSKGVRGLFKQRMVSNISYFLKKSGSKFKILSWHQRMFIITQDFTKAADVLKRTFGVVWFAKCFFLEKTSLVALSKFIKENYQQWLNKGATFALRLRKDSMIKKSREQIIDLLAKNIKRKVDLDNPRKEIFIEGRKQGWFLYFNKQKGPGGLPVASQGKALCLISGGIDSPVAAHLIAKRGAENVWCHFHSFPLVSRVSIEKVKDLARIFLRYQPKLKIYFVPFSEIQKQIKINIPAKYRVLLYRRLMLKMAQRIAQKQGCRALVTGESLGQVSSQTLPNLQITSQGLKLPVLRPLIGKDKKEIIDLAKKIGFFDISIQPQEDCCTLFAPKHQTAFGRVEEIKEYEKKLKLSKLISQALKNSEVERL